MEAQFAHRGYDELAASVRRIQESERAKLHATMQLHALRKAESFGTFSWLEDKSALICGPSATAIGLLLPPLAHESCEVLLLPLPSLLVAM